MNYYPWTYGFCFSIVKVFVWTFAIQVINGMIRLGSFAAVRDLPNFPNLSYFIEQIFVACGFQCKTFGYESLLADSSYNDLCSSKYDERGGIDCVLLIRKQIGK